MLAISSRKVAIVLGSTILLGSTGVRAAVVSTTVTTYTYNADGAPTAVTAQVDGGDASTLYLTWDNFVPDANDPSTGTVSAANGNLAAAGSSPSAASPVYTFDRRDRLVGYSAGAQALTYAYHADGTMASSTTAGGEGLAFYYGGGRLPQIVNMRQQSAGLWSAHLGPVRQVSDGNEQILMTPRKDVAGEYDAGAETMSAYRYDAFGACSCAGSCTCADGSGAYDIHDNPFRYAGEYRDAIWQGQYLRARWYDAQVPTFVSRDPLAHLNRYGYGDANPVMMTDPRGMKPAFLKGFDAAIDWLGSGVQGHFARLLLSPVLYPMEIVAHPVRFWNQLKRDPVEIAFIGVSAIAGAVGKLAGAGLATLELRQTGIGLAQSVFAGFGDLKSKHFDAMAFIDSAESAVGTSLSPALVGGIRGLRGREGFVNSVEDVARKLPGLDDSSFLMFRGREPMAGGVNYTNPFLENAKLGAYNEIVVAVTKDELVATTMIDGDVRSVEFRGAVDRDTLSRNLQTLSRRPDDEPAFEFKPVRKNSGPNAIHYEIEDEEPTKAGFVQKLAGGSKNHWYAALITRRIREE